MIELLTSISQRTKLDVKELINNGKIITNDLSNPSGVCKRTCYRTESLVSTFDFFLLFVSAKKKKKKKKK